jgi:hypothetical protein
VRAAATVGLLALLAVAVPTRAAGDEGDARAHFDAGLKAFEEGEYDRAVVEFETAWKLKPHPDFLINIATTYERLYKPKEARETYERFLAEAPPTSDLRALAEKRLRVLRTLRGSILVDARQKDATVHLTGAGIDVTKNSGSTFTELLPGTYHVHVEFPGYSSIDVDVNLAPGESHAVTDPLLIERETLTVLSVPDHARVFIDNVDTGEVTPLSRALEVGAHALRLELPDREPHAETVELKVGKPAFRRVNLPLPPRSGRTEMVLASMLYGGYAGTALTIAIGGSRVTTGTGIAALTLTALGGVGLGLLGAWALTDEGMKVGHSSIIIGSTLWGTLAGTSLAFGLGLNNQATQQSTLAVSLAGSVLGLGAGILTARKADPSAGDAALVNSGGLWGYATGTLLTEALSRRRGDHDQFFGWLSLGGEALGLATGSVMARGFEVSRRRVAVIDAAGLLGAVLGYGIGYAAGDDSPDPDSGTLCPGPVNRCVSGARYALGGMVLGIVTASILTSRLHFDVPKTEALIARHGDRWAIGLPQLHLGAALTPRGVAQQATLDLASGDW